MAPYQVRKWNRWHHHMALVMLAMNFLLKEQLAHRVAVRDLTLSDLVFAIDALLPHRAHDPNLRGRAHRRTTPTTTERA